MNFDLYNDTKDNEYLCKCLYIDIKLPFQNTFYSNLTIFGYLYDVYKESLNLYINIELD